MIDCTNARRTKKGELTDLDRACLEAREHGMSYGQYQSYLRENNLDWEYKTRLTKPSKRKQERERTKCGKLSYPNAKVVENGNRRGILLAYDRDCNLVAKFRNLDEASELTGYSALSLTTQAARSQVFELVGELQWVYSDEAADLDKINYWPWFWEIEAETAKVIRRYNAPKWVHRYSALNEKEARKYAEANEIAPNGRIYLFATTPEIKATDFVIDDDTRTILLGEEYRIGCERYGKAKCLP